MLITFNSVNFSYIGDPILSDINFTLNEGERVGLIGENGAGKTTLLKLITGAIYPESGDIQKKNGATFGFLEQTGGLEAEGTVYSEMLLAVKPQLDAISRLAKLSEDLSAAGYGSAEYKQLSSKYEAVEKYIAAHDCYNAEVRVKTVLGGMGFAGLYEQKISTMSGGEKTRLKLARLLLEEPDLLILDEPTNHLDIKTLFWLEEYLAAFRGAVLVVSHDRYFLDRVCSRTLEIENKRLFSYPGNYTKYKVLKAERLALEQKEYERQQEERARLQDYVDRNIVRATTAKSALSRVNRLERMEILEKPYTPPAPPRFKFVFPVNTGELVLDIKNLDLSVGGKTLFNGGSLQLTRGKKLAVVGENGTGKSTLLKLIAGGGNYNCLLGRFVKIAYYDQENLNLNPENTVLAELWERHVSSSQTDVRARLARCGLVAEDMYKKVGELSGGERAKLALSVLEAEEGNVLLLDEPTNHLDLPARESLERALKEFGGTLIFVSHDRYFISALADCVAEIEGGKLNFVNGNYESFREEKRRQAKELAEMQAKEAQQAYLESRREGYRSKKERAAEAAQKARIKQIEEAISKNEEEEAALSEKLADPAVTADYREIERLCRRLDELKREQEELYIQYDKLI
ncbi:MAG TPA: ATP-binding cassette domain-containing protein [Candidatus Coproplasma stercoripullorum]|uniref:ATP-binding cassette domain-containing protein n=1 Tax=Candidatus Coproplasma stercoripullorum TaxID=2840751 RepID=A0A9D1AED9_9FIRM|nr:ATP-binding cassette domain-containing protein [Candidatus Coproplasma stercoripullorum]